MGDGEAKKDRFDPGRFELCPKCRHWRPMVLTDALGIIRGSRCCYCEEPREDSSCFEPRDTGKADDNEKDR